MDAVERKERLTAMATARLPRELRLFWAGTLALVLLAVVVGWLKHRAGATEPNWNPLGDPLFGDMMEYPGSYTLLHTKAFFFNVEGRPWPYPMYSPVAYPPFAAAVMAPLYAFPIPVLLFLVVAAVWLAVVVVWASRRLMCAGVGRAEAVLFPLTLVLLSFPIARLIHQGNIELVLWMFTAVGVWAFLRGKDDAAAVLWGLAAAMKLFPLVLLGLLLPRRRFRAFAEGLATFVGATVLSLWWLGPTIGVAWRGSLKNVFGYQGARMSEWTINEIVANHSLIEIGKLVALIERIPMGKLAVPYYALGGVMLAAGFFGKLWKLPVANQLLGISVFMVMFPPISYYHALVHLYAPFALLCWVAISAHRAGMLVKGLQGTMLLFLPLFAPFTVLTYPHALMFCGLLQSVVLLILFVRAMEYPFPVYDASGEAMF